MQRNFSDINENSMSSQSVSMSQSLSEVCRVLSQCRVTIASSNEDPSQHLSDVELILSEMNQLVQTISDKQKQQQNHHDEQELCWDYYDIPVLSDYSSCSSSDVSSDVLEDVNVGDLFVLEDSFITKITNAIKRYAPNYTFSRAKHERRMTRKMMKMIPKELHCLWRNVDSITGLAPAVVPVSTPVPKVNWSVVNTRALANVPKPKLYPKHGCSPDPAFYERYQDYEMRSDGKTLVNCKPKHQQANPFGSEWGLETDAGVIDVSGVVVHGHTWSPEKGAWLIHAEIQSGGGGPSHREAGGRERDRRSRGRQRGKYRTCG